MGDRHPDGGFGLAVAMTVVTLCVNRAPTARPLPLLVVLMVAGLMLVQVRLLYGTVSRNITGVFTLIKRTGFLLLSPAVFYLLPDWPQWIAKLFSTYWVINPIYEVTINRAGLGTVWVELVIGLGMAVLLAGAVAAATRRLRAQLAAV